MIYTGTYIIYVHVIITSFIKGMLFTASYVIKVTSLKVWGGIRRRYVIKVTSLKSLGWNQKGVEQLSFKIHFKVHKTSYNRKSSNFRYFCK